MAELATAALFGAVVMIFLQSGSPWLADNDSFYHIKMARLLPELGFIDKFPWLHWTIFRERFVSHHHGFHVFLAPFAAASESLTGGLVAGAKAANVIAMSLTCLTFCVLLRHLNVKHAPIWLLALACAPWHFWLRMSYIRAPMIALPLMILALWLILKGRTVWLAFVAFALTQVYNGAVLLLLLPVALVLTMLLCRESVRSALRQTCAVIIGVSAGFVLHPYFPANLDFLRTQLFGSGLGAPREAGIEWRSYDARFFLMISGPLIAIWATCLAHRWRSGIQLSARSIFLLLVNLVFLALTLKARRFIEYWPVFALINAADFATFPAATGIKTERARTRRRAWPTALLVGMIATVGLFNLMTVRANIRPSYDPGQLREPMAHLQAHSPAGSIVFTDDWDVFPYCFFWNHHNRYIVGLDPVFTMEKYPLIWERYRLITRGQTPATLSDENAGESEQRVTIRDIGMFFEAKYVLVASDHPALYKQLLNDAECFRIIYPSPADRDDSSQAPFTVFEVSSSAAADTDSAEL